MNLLILNAKWSLLKTPDIPKKCKNDLPPIEHKKRFPTSERMAKRTIVLSDSSTDSRRDYDDRVPKLYGQHRSRERERGRNRNHHRHRNYSRDRYYNSTSSDSSDLDYPSKSEHGSYYHREKRRHKYSESSDSSPGRYVRKNRKRSLARSDYTMPVKRARHGKRLATDRELIHENADVFKPAKRLYRSKSVSQLDKVRPNEKTQIVRRAKLAFLPKIPPFTVTATKKKPLKNKVVETQTQAKGNKRKNGSNEAAPQKNPPALIQQFVKPSTSKEEDILRAESAANVALLQSTANVADKENVSPDGLSRDDFVKLCQINDIAVHEIDILKAERRQILCDASKVYKERDVLKVKYDRLLEKYSYLFGKVNNDNNIVKDQNSGEPTDENEPEGTDQNVKIHQRRLSV